MEQYLIVAISIAGGVLVTYLASWIVQKKKDKEKVDQSNINTILNTKEIKFFEQRIDELHKEITHLYDDNKNAINDNSKRISKVDEVVRRLELVVAEMRGAEKESRG